MDRFITKILLFLAIVSCSTNSTENEDIEQYCGVYEGDVTLKTMIEIEEFASCNYTEITGDLAIFDGNVAYPITDLSSLSSLTKIGGRLTLVNLSALDNFRGLHNITSVKSFNLAGAELIENLDDIDKMQTDIIEISYNPVLQNIDGLDMESDSMNGIAIFYCPLLTNLNCFSNITSVGYSITIKGNHSLIDLYGLENIESVGTIHFINGSLIIENNYNLKSINGLSNLKNVTGGIRISSNFFLDNIDGLSNLQSIVNGNFFIRSNTYLQNLNGLQNLTNVEGDFYITGNELLRKFCGLQNLLLADGIRGDLFIKANSNNPTVQDILVAPPCD